VYNLKLKKQKSSLFAGFFAYSFLKKELLAIFLTDLKSAYVSAFYEAYFHFSKIYFWGSYLYLSETWEQNSKVMGQNM